MTMQTNILAAMEEQLNDWQKLLDPISSRRVELPLTPSLWSIKDTLAHLWAWQQRSLIRIQAANQGKEPIFQEWGHGSDAEEDLQANNDWIYQNYHGLSFNEVQLGWRKNYEQFIALGSGFDEMSFLDGDTYPWLGGFSLADVYLGSYGHHLEHYKSITNWLASHPA